MRAIKIDVIKKEIYEVDIPKGIDAIYSQLEIDTPFTVIALGEGEDLFIDDEGLLKDEPLGAFEIQGYPQVLSGHGLILGVNPKGESTGSNLQLSLIKKYVTFRNVEDLPEPGFFTSF